MTNRTLGSYHVDLVDQSIDQYVSIAGESLLSDDPKVWETYIQRIGRENIRGVFTGNELVGGLAFYRVGQWFGGREIATAGVSGVGIHPAHRGSGACGLLMRQTLQELHDEGIPLSSLYASTQRLYRQCGYAQAGTQTKYSLPLSDLAASGLPLQRELPIFRFPSKSQTPPLSALRYADQIRAKKSNGLFQRTDGLFHRLLHPFDGRGSITYLLGDESKPDGYVILKPGVREHGIPQPLVATDVVANSPRSLGRLAALLYDHRSMQQDFQWFGSPVDPLVLYSTRSIVNVREQLRWLLRIVHLPGAIAARGYPASVSGQLHLAIEDPLIDANAGAWVVDIDNGNASVEPGGVGCLQLKIDWLAALFSGYLTPTQLIDIGELTTSKTGRDVEQQLELFTAAFSGPPPWLPELF
tara:strand:+ start:137372 stop:138607 length:1236 start_codon:yes stop_codon:yes gene_type:complete